ncbi:ComF family protein [Streptomyces sp. NPDC051684]|uniref:ComF family protein n=1 Tax=Streptomyces sp. NPDC051684 TaxID=3365670 RepID=UPI003788ACBF
MRGWWQDLSDLVLPAECAGCGRSRTALCARCSAVLRGAEPRRVRPRPAPSGLPVVFGAVPYRNAVRAVLLAHKERGALGLARPLGEALAGAVRAGLVDGGAGGGGAGGRAPGGVVGPVTLVPVPSAPRAVRARGHDPTRRIAYAAAAELRRAGVAARVLAVLRQRRAVADQSGLDARQRLVNVTGALEVVGGGRGLLTGNGRIVLVDDLITTGASLAEAARAIAAVTGSGKIEREDRPERDRSGTGPGKGNGSGEITFRAAVVAASPESFEINRN